MNPDTPGKPESEANDPEQLSRLIDLDLVQKRVVWKKSAARRQQVRLASVLFLLLLIVASLFAFFMLFSRANEERGKPRPAAARSSSRP
jgi:hypothetical protein